MKKSIIIAVLLTNALNESAIAQWSSGGFGNFIIGPVYNSTSSLQNDLQSSTILGSSIQLNKIGLLLGGSGYSLRSSGIVIGGSGFAYQVSSNAPAGNVTFDNAVGFFNLGYCTLNKKNKLGFPYIGIGWHGSQFDVSNTTSDAIIVIGNDTIAHNEVRSFTNEGFAFEAGYSLKYFFPEKEVNKNSKTGGVLVGIDAGASFCPAFDYWKGSTEIVSMEKPFIMSFYLRASIGFGSFKESNKQENQQ